MLDPEAEVLFLKQLAGESYASVKSEVQVIPSPSSTTSTSEERSLRGSRRCSGVHTIVTAAKKFCLTQWQVVSYRVNVEGEKGNLAKSQAVLKRAKVRFEEKSEWGDYIAQGPNWLPQQDS